MVDKRKEQQLINRIKELSERMHSLECSDDGLFINGSGNLEIWKTWEKERDEAQKQLNNL